MKCISITHKTNRIKQQIEENGTTKQRIERIAGIGGKMEDGILGTFSTIATALFIGYGLISTKASKKDIEEIKEDFENFKDKTDKKLMNYASKEDLKNLKEDIIRAITTHEHTVASRIEDKFNTILTVLDKTNTKDRKK